jgi:hypothetical protein
MSLSNPVLIRVSKFIHCTKYLDPPLPPTGMPMQCPRAIVAPATLPSQPSTGSPCLSHSLPLRLSSLLAPSILSDIILALPPLPLRRHSLPRHPRRHMLIRSLCALHAHPLAVPPLPHRTLFRLFPLAAGHTVPSPVTPALPNPIHPGTSTETNRTRQPSIRIVLPSWKSSRPGLSPFYFHCFHGSRRCLNRLLAQKEVQHREVVDSLTERLSFAQVRRQHEDLNMLPRPGALPRSTEIWLRSYHCYTL